MRSTSDNLCSDQSDWRTVTDLYSFAVADQCSGDQTETVGRNLRFSHIPCVLIAPHMPSPTTRMLARGLASARTTLQSHRVIRTPVATALSSTRWRLNRLPSISLSDSRQQMCL